MLGSFGVCTVLQEHAMPRPWSVVTHACAACHLSCRVTDAANITELGDFGHLEVLKHPDGLAQLGQVLGTLLGLPGSSSSSGTSDNSTAASADNSTAASVDNSTATSVEDSQALGNSTSEADSAAAGTRTVADAAAGDVIEIADRSVELIEVTTSDDIIEVTAGPALPKPFASKPPWEGLAGLQQQISGYVGIAAIPGDAGQDAQQQQQQQQQGSVPPGNSTGSQQ
jgi:hypothetical protein